VAAGGEVAGGSEAGHAGADDDGIVDGHVVVLLLRLVVVVELDLCGCSSLVVLMAGCSMNNG
jgi:hypothetical protein